MADRDTSLRKYEEYLNELGTSLDVEDFILEGKYRGNADGSNYGRMLRKHDPIAFRMGYREWVALKKEEQELSLLFQSNINAIERCRSTLQKQNKLNEASSLSEDDREQVRRVIALLGDAIQILSEIK